ncbi:MAG: hypothetical protein WCZ90_15885 [Melioribacteraceae bacterium]
MRSTIQAAEKLSDPNIFDFNYSKIVTKIDAVPQTKWSKLDFVLSVLIVTTVIVIYIYFSPYGIAG